MGEGVGVGVGDGRVADGVGVGDRSADDGVGVGAKVATASVLDFPGGKNGVPVVPDLTAGRDDVVAEKATKNTNKRTTARLRNHSHL